MISEDILGAAKIALVGFWGARPGEDFESMCTRMRVPINLKPAVRLGWDLFPWHARLTLDEYEMKTLRAKVRRWRGDEWTGEEIFYVLRLSQNEEK